MFWLIVSAGFTGFIHSLTPHHWVPLVLLSKTKKWSNGETLLGACTVAGSHIFLSVSLSILIVIFGSQLFDGLEHEYEIYFAWGLIGFGAIYALWSYYRHRKCHGHTHHGPAPSKNKQAKKRPYLFLFLLGFYPCFAVLPVFTIASAYNQVLFAFTLLAFSLGVLIAITLATFLALHGFRKLDHPLLEHYADVFIGLALVVVGGILFLHAV